MSWLNSFLLFGGGAFAGFVNSMAGGWSLLTVPLLSIAGVGGVTANGTNRVAVSIQLIASVRGYHRGNVRPYDATARFLPQSLVGALIGALLISRLEDKAFEQLFGILMIPLLVLTLWNPRTRQAAKPWPRWLEIITFLGIGIYAGAFQAGVGLMLLMVLSRTGFDLVTGNAIKTHIVVAVTTVVAIPVFLLNGQIDWLPALVLSAGGALGGYVGAVAAVDRGERLIRPVLVVAVIALAGRMVDLY